MDELAPRMREVFKDRAQDKSVYDIDEPIIRGRGTAAYVDALAGDDHVGRATHMLSYWWGYRVLGVIIPTLEAFCENNRLDPKRTYVWICCLCIDQNEVQRRRRAGRKISFEAFEELFESRVREIGHILPLMSPWASPKYLERVWCVFEFHTAHRVKARITLLIPPEDQSSLCRVVMDDEKRKTVYQALGSIDITEAKASEEEDRTNILKLVDKHGGIERLNDEARRASKSSYIDALRDAFEVTVRDPSWPSEEKAELCSHISMMLFDDGRPEAAFALLREGARLLDPIEPPSEAVLLTQRGFLKMKGHGSPGEMREARADPRLAEAICLDLEEAKADLQRAEAICLDLNAAESARGARLYEGLGVAFRKLYETPGAAPRREHNLEEARKMFDRARGIHEALRTLDTMKAATLLYNIGRVRFEQRDLGGAGTWYDRARKIREREGTLKTPGGSLLMDAVARLRAEQGDLDLAIAAGGEAVAGRSLSCTVGSPAGASQREHLGALVADRDSMAEQGASERKKER